MDAPIRENFSGGYLGSFLSNTLKTNQLEVNTDVRTLRPIARLKEPRDLFALPKERENECAQQLPRWPNECQVLDERVYHIEYAPETPEPYYKATGKELQPRPVGEEHGIIVYNYMPISAVHYRKLNKRTDIVRTYGRNEDHIHMKKIENDFEFWGDYADEEIRQRHIIVGREVQKSLDNYYYFNYIKNPREFECNFCFNRINPDQNRFNAFLKHIDIINHSNHYDCIPDSEHENYNFDADVDPCWCNNMPQFSRSSVGGSKYLLSAQPYALDPDDLIFESRFESGNLARVVKVTQNYYELYLRPDMYTNRHTQWFYFRVKNTRSKTPYRFSIVNLTKPDSLYKEGMRPLMYSTTDATNNNIGWRRCGENIAYFRNDDNNIYSTRNYHQVLIDDFDDDDTGNICSFTLTFNVEFQHDNDTVYFAHSYPYTYSDLQDYLMNIQRHPIKSKFCKLRLLCRSLAGNNVYYLTVTAPLTPEEETQKKKKAVVITARVHPGETPSSWMMKGFMDFITGDSYVAKKLRHKFIFKLVPMLNPDGVIVGNTRSSLTGRDLNRQYRTVIRETYPSIWNTKAMIKRLMEDCSVALYCDMHAHSRKHNIFIYGCENMKRHPDRRLLEQVFPLMLHKNVADKFSFENCKFRVQKNKEGTGRIVVWVLGVTNSYTLEASFAGSTLGGRAGTHFSTMDYEHLGRAFCETLMDYYDDNPLKSKYHKKIYYDLERYYKHVRREFDETEAYLRHRERVKERERREKAKKQGKLEAYLKKKEEKEKAEKAKKELEFEEKMKQYEEFRKKEDDTKVKFDIDVNKPKPPDMPSFEEMMREYQERRKADEEEMLRNYAKVEVDEKKVEQVVKRMKLKKKHEKMKKARMEEDEIVIEDPDEFRPRMAGKTGLPTFFFSNLVSQNRNSFAKNEARNRMNFKKFTPKSKH